MSSAAARVNGIGSEGHSAAAPASMSWHPPPLHSQLLHTRPQPGADAYWRACPCRYAVLVSFSVYLTGLDPEDVLLRVRGGSGWEGVW